MTSAQGGGNQKEDKMDKGGGRANLDVIFLDDINSALRLQSIPKKIIFDRMDSLLILILMQYFAFSNNCLIE